MSDSLRDLRDLAGPPKPTPPGPIERPLPRLKKPPQPIKARNNERMAKRNAEAFGEQGELARKRPCCACGKRPTVAAHVRSRGAGGRSEDICALCWACHSYAHDHGNAALEEKHGVSLEAEAAKLAAELERKKGHDCEAAAKLVEHEPGLVSFYRCTVCGYRLPDEQEGSGA